MNAWTAKALETAHTRSVACRSIQEQTLPTERTHADGSREYIPALNAETTKASTVHEAKLIRKGVTVKRRNGCSRKNRVLAILSKNTRHR